MHPFNPLTPHEISTAASVVRSSFGKCAPNFRVITLQEPPKDLMVDYLNGEHHHKPNEVKIPRCARVEVVVKGSTGDNDLYDLLVNLDTNQVFRKEHQIGKHSYIDADYMKQVEAVCLANERVQAEIKTLKLPDGASVVVEPWAYATDGMNDMSKRVSMCYFYLRLLEHKDANYYAYPLDICAEISEDLEVIKLYRLPISLGESIHQESRLFDQRHINQTSDSEYHPDLRPNPRTTTKPLHIVQPEGPSFSVQGQHVEWENWSFRIGFNYREGLTLHDIRYGPDHRSLFYRLSLAEMFVPYGDPRTPYPRKGAFDLGNDGAGINANNLKLGCDCLGTIKYFDGWHTTATGTPLKLPNAICLHEQDDGILWKHTNFRTQNAVVARSRILVVQTIITVTNYEYIFAFHFTQDASIFFEVRATGILSTVPIAINAKKMPWGTTVAPGVLAPFHQHLFSLRIDPAIDGQKNSLFIEESVPLPFDGSNPLGVGYTTESRIVKEEGGFDLDFTKNRTFKFVNEAKINPITQTPVGFKLLPHYSQMLLAHPASFHAKRSEFASHAIWVTRYKDDDLWPSGRYTMQSAGGNGIESGIASRRAKAIEDGKAESIRNSDIVIWHTFGSTHNPRIEDWPVMPSEKMVVGLKPVNFFNGNPGIDVAVSRQDGNRSVLYDELSVTNGNCSS